MRFFSVLAVVGLASSASAAPPMATTTKTVTSTQKSTTTDFVTNTKTNTVYSTVTSTKTVVSVSTATSTKTVTSKYTAAPSTVTSTVTETSTQTVALPASTVTVSQTSTETDSTTVTQTTTSVPDPVTQTVTESDSTTLVQTTTAPASTVTVTESDSTAVTQTQTTTAQAVTVTQPALTVTQPASTITVVSTVTGASNSSSSASSSSASPSSSSSSVSSSVISSSNVVSNSTASTSATTIASSSSSTITGASTTSTASPSSVAASVEYTATAASSVHAAQATALTSSPTSNVQGAAFNRIVFIWLENTDYSLASTDPNLQYLASLGMTLTNYYGVTHPSEPNYIASHGGDNFGCNNDNVNYVNANVSTVFDLLDTKGISWGEYQEDMPYSGYEGKQWLNQTTGQNAYVRKHNPGAMFNSATQSAQRLSQMKNMSMFYQDLANNQLPQWMFITPNMQDDGHDTSVTVAGLWTRNFLEPLLNDSNFMDNTLVLVTFDETETYTLSNNVYTFVLGDALPSNLVGTTDSTYYNHYSQISTVSANWGLPTLGRNDVGANVYSPVAAATGDSLRNWTATSHLPDFSHMFFNSSFAGPFNSVNLTYVGYPAPNTDAVINGRTVLPSVQSTWGAQSASSFYTGGVQIYDGMHPPPGF